MSTPSPKPLDPASIFASILADVAKLKDPKVAASFLGLVTDLVLPLFGVHIGPVATAITGVLTFVGLVVSYIEEKTKRVQATAKILARRRT